MPAEEYAEAIVETVRVPLVVLSHRPADREGQYSFLSVLPDHPARNRRALPLRSRRVSVEAVPLCGCCWRGLSPPISHSPTSRLKPPFPPLGTQFYYLMLARFRGNVHERYPGYYSLWRNLTQRRRLEQIGPESACGSGSTPGPTPTHPG